MDIQGLVRNGINTEIRELKENIQVQNFKLKYDGYGDRKEAESAIHQFKFAIRTLTHVKEEIARRIGFSIFDVFGNFYTACLDRDDLVKELKRSLQKIRKVKKRVLIRRLDSYLHKPLKSDLKEKLLLPLQHLKKPTRSILTDI